MTDRIPAPPPGLRDLAEVDSPEIVRAALRRFRRGLLVRVIVILLVIGAFIGLRMLTRDTYLPNLLEAGPGVDIGKVIEKDSVTATVIEARRHDGDPAAKYGLRVVFAAEGLKRGERLHIEPAMSSCLPDANAMETGPTVGDIYDLGGGPGAREMWIVEFVGTERIPVTVGASSARGGRPRQTDVPLMTELPCDTFLSAEPDTQHIRFLTTIYLEPKELGVPAAIWRDRDER